MRALLGLDGGSSGRRAEIKSKQRELRALRKEARAPVLSRGEWRERKRKKKQKQQEIFELKLRSGKEHPESEPGALPDFVVIGAMKGGTTWLYHLLVQHPLVEPAAAKELHYFDVVFEDETVEWYRRCFPPPQLKDGRKTITGEATPYLPHLLAPERMARVVPEARLISVLRNPVDRAYSHYQQAVRKGRETHTFEEAIKLEEIQPLDEAPESADDSRRKYLSKSIYADQLPRWSKFFGEDRMMILRSEDLFERTPETLESVFGFLGLPEWMPEEATRTVPEKRRNEGGYGQVMDPATRQRLEEYFGPHNRRLYEYLGRDLGW